MALKELKRYRHLIIGITAALVAALTIWAVIYMFSFLVMNLNGALDVQITPAPKAQFDTQGFEQLHLIPEQQK